MNNGSPSTAPKSKKEHIGRGVEPPHRPIDIERLHAGLAREALREHYLENIARGDVLLRVRDHGLICLLRHVRADLGGRDIGLAGGGQRLGDALRDLIKLAVCGFPIAIKDVGDQEDAAARMIKGDDRVGEEVNSVRYFRAERRDIVLLSRSRSALHSGCQRWLKITDRLIPKIADQPTGKARRVGQALGGEATHLFL